MTGGKGSRNPEAGRQAYLRLNTDTENNRYWGYD